MGFSVSGVILYDTPTVTWGGFSLFLSSPKYESDDLLFVLDLGDEFRSLREDGISVHLMGNK